jgi:hypothetical protein
MHEEFSRRDIDVDEWIVEINAAGARALPATA